MNFLKKLVHVGACALAFGLSQAQYYDLTVSSEPQGLFFKVFNRQGGLLLNGYCPLTVNLSKADKLVVKLYYMGKEVATQEVDDFQEDTVINFIAKK